MSKYYTIKSKKIFVEESEMELFILHPTINAKPLHDCYAALKYLKEHADELGINSSQIMVGGESAGGGLTAALCMYARDKAEVNIFIDRKIKKLYDIDSRVSHDYLRYDHI